INKMDQQGAVLSEVVEELQKNLSSRCVLADSEEFFEKAALCDEELLETYLETGTVSQKALAELVRGRKLFPCFAGSALKMEGIDEFLAGLNSLTVCGKHPEEFGARIYKISRDEQGNRLTHMKITGGTLSVKQQIGEDKVNQIRIYSGRKFAAVQSVSAGAVCAVTGLSDTFCGQGLGFEPAGRKPYLDTVLNYQVQLPEDWEMQEAFKSFQQLEEEIPELHAAWDAETKQLTVRMMGEIQGEILKKVTEERFGRKIDFGEEKILYRETITKTVEGVGHFEPLRHYAEAHILMEPLPAGSGVIFDTACSEDELDRNWQNLILTHLAERQHPGVLTGAPVTDIKFILVSGRGHLKHTEGGDFRQATYRAVRQGLRKGESVLLEPYYKFRLELPSDCVGRAMNDIQNMSGTFEPTESAGDLSVLTGDAPVAEMNGYHKDVISYTKGRGRLYCNLKGYFPCHNQEAVISSSGYDPDRDIENPCGSVFCSHGAGVNVPWNEVEDHMHIPLSYSPKEDKDSAQNAAHIPSHRRSYSDEELEAVFRQTYGISGRDNGKFRKSSRIIRADTGISGPKVQSGYNKADAEEVLLIDGYNMIFAWEELSDMADLSLESARNLLVETLCSYQSYWGKRTIVVFDAYRQPGNIGMTENILGVEVVYTKEG
ncbi:MAG: NYN domain-containing protein, partial [Emergencia sp.]|nr:NYN domain-containing protein [Emergencia sp.]